MKKEEIMEQLLLLRDENYATFQHRLIPTVDANRIIGIRTPALRKMAKDLAKAGVVPALLGSLPHHYFEENQLHAFLLSSMKDFAQCMEETENFLPHIDNWATCDQLSPKVFGRNRSSLLPYIAQWTASEHEYTVRFGIKMLMEHFLDDASFDVAQMECVASIHRDEYYIRMMQAWYFATALAKQYDATLPYLLHRRLDPWVHQKTIQKAIESYRITDEQKTVLKGLRIKKNNPAL